jgi:uncharacterized delta-60 repeat protein
MKTKNYLSLIILVLFNINLSSAQVNMDLDPSFGNGGIYKNVINNEFFAYNLFSAVQSDGKILNAGLLGNYNTGLTDTLVVYRFNTNGTLDNSFGINGAAYAPIPSGLIYNNNYLNALTVQSDGKILIMAEAIDTINYNRTILVRFNTNGTSDNTFGQNGMAFHNVFHAEYYTSINVQSSGKILMSGVMLLNDGIPHAILTRLNSDGSSDTLFDATYGDSKIFDTIDGTTGSINANLIITPNGSLLMDLAQQVTIQGTQINGNLSLVRLNADGTTDSSFAVNGATEPIIFSINNSLPKNAILSLTNGKYAIAHYDNNSTYIKMFNTNGSNDLNFNVTGYLAFSIPTPKDYALPSLFETSNGNLIVSQATLDSTDAMMNEYASHLLIGVNANGTLMNTFGTNGFVKTYIGQYGLIGRGSKQTDGKLVFPAYSYSTRGYGIRYESSIPNSMIKHNVGNSNISIFPNPFNGVLNIKYHSAEQTKTIIAIYDLTGKEILNQVVNNQLAGDYYETFIMPYDMQPGSYICKIINNKDFNSYLINYIK